MAWRPLLRAVVAYLVVFAALTLFLLAVAVTRAPGSPTVERLARLPVAGSWVERLRRPYIDAAAAAAARAAAAGAEAPTVGSHGVAEAVTDSVGPRQRETLFVGIGAALRSAPDDDAEVVLTTTRLNGYPVLERRAPSWVRLELPQGSAWLDLEAPRDRTPPLGVDPLPNVPIAARVAEPRLLEAAREQMSAGSRSWQQAGYRWLSDLADPALEGRLAALLEGVEERYTERYGVAPIGTPAETVALFSSEGAYRRFQEEIEGLAGLERVSSGHAAGGMAALYVGSRPAGEVATTLVHEIAHLLTRRALGPALPLWLDEGIAEDFAYFAGPASRPLAQYRSQQGNQVRIWGPLAGLRQLERPGAEVSLERLTSFSQDLFVRSPDALLLYTQSAFLVNYLLSPRAPVTSVGDGSVSSHPATESLPQPRAFRAFLGAVRAGAPASLERLVAELAAAAPGERWSEALLERRFAAHLARLQREAPGLLPDGVVPVGP